GAIAVRVLLYSAAFCARSPRPTDLHSRSLHDALPISPPLTPRKTQLKSYLPRRRARLIRLQRSLFPACRKKLKTLPTSLALSCHCLLVQLRPCVMKPLRTWKKLATPRATLRSPLHRSGQMKPLLERSPLKTASATAPQTKTRAPVLSSS